MPHFGALEVNTMVSTKESQSPKCAMGQSQKYCVS
jgi:hypothetical protein